MVFLVDTGTSMFVVEWESGGMGVDAVVETGVFKQRKEGIIIVEGVEVFLSFLSMRNYLILSFTLLIKLNTKTY